jgi:ankyrin repeat protein
MLKEKITGMINSQDDDGMTPLHLSILSGQSKVTRKLIQRGAEKEIKNNEGKTAGDLINESKRLQMTSIFEKKDCFSNWKVKFTKDKVVD